MVFYLQSGVGLKIGAVLTGDLEFFNPILFRSKSAAYQNMGNDFQMVSIEMSFNSYVQLSTISCLGLGAG